MLGRVKNPCKPIMPYLDFDARASKLQCIENTYDAARMTAAVSKIGVTNKASQQIWIVNEAEKLVYLTRGLLTNAGFKLYVSRISNSC